jgi:hypothetical protein
MKIVYRLLAAALALISLLAAASAQQPAKPVTQSMDESCPLHQQHTQEQKHDEHSAGVNQRGTQAMGFSQTKTAHHFLLKADGGVIQVEANQAEDTASRDQIRQHLRQIAGQFAAGDFVAPLFIHAQTPPGVPTMQGLKAEIKYEFEETERGARVRFSTRNAEAAKAIHEFLRFQIKDHQTGDPGEVEKQSN